ncbi:RNA polymerase sigma factor [Irregularibacter muris]|nr:RNA polymerase sigma factor [Irregularibacter muris]
MTLEERIHRIQQGKNSEFEWIVEEYKNKIYTLAYGYTMDAYMAQDLTQEILMKVYQNIRSFQGQSSFSTWLYRVAKNQCIDWIRKNKRRIDHTILEDGEREFRDLRPSPEEKAIKEETNQRLYDALGQLPERYRVPLMMFHFQELSYEEIGKALGLPSKTVATQLYRGKKLLREKLLSKKGDDMPWTVLL